jgi:hypothetical protein
MELLDYLDKRTDLNIFLFYIFKDNLRDLCTEENMTRLDAYFREPFGYLLDEYPDCDYVTMYPYIDSTTDDARRDGIRLLMSIAEPEFIAMGKETIMYSHDFQSIKAHTPYPNNWIERGDDFAHFKEYLNYTVKGYYHFERGYRGLRKVALPKGALKT